MDGTLAGSVRAYSHAEAIEAVVLDDQAMAPSPPVQPARPAA